jgi:hypothetical protein
LIIYKEIILAIRVKRLKQADQRNTEFHFIIDCGTVVDSNLSEPADNLNSHISEPETALCIQHPTEYQRHT